MKKIMILCFMLMGSLPICVHAQFPTIDFAIGISSSHMGGGSSKKVAVDNLGNSYIVGAIQGTTDFDPTASTANLIASDVDGFLAKYDGNGNYKWAIRIGSTVYDQTYGVAVDDSGNIYVTGLIEGTVDMDPGVGVANISAPELGLFIAKYDSSANYLWAFAVSGPSPTTVNDMHLDESGNIYITGSFGNTVDFDPSASTANLIMGPGVTYDGYLAKYNSNGDYIWARALNSDNSIQVNAISTDNTNSIYIAGRFNGIVDFDPGAGVVNLTSASSTNMFIAKYTSAGNYSWALNIGDASNSEEIQDITVDGINNVIVTGNFAGTNSTDFNPGVGSANYTPFSSVYTDGFVAKYSPAGIYIWAYPFGGNNSDVGLGITTDPARNIYVTGYYNDTVDFDPSVSTSNLIANGIQPDMFVTKYNILGGLMWASSMGGAGVEDSRSVAVDNNGKLWISGTFQSSPADFDPSAGSYLLNAPGAGTIFLAKYEYCTPTNINEVSHSDISCFNGSDGSIHIHPLGTSPYTFNWSPSGGTDSIATNLTAGLYSCTVTSSCGTLNTITVSLSQPSQIIPSVISQTNIFCNADSTGMVEVGASGGVGTYDFIWLPGGMNTALVSGLTAGTYTCTLTDDNSCTATQTITITQPAAIGFIQSPQLCSGDSIVVGSSIYYITGNYSDIFVAANGCDSTVTTLLTVHPPINSTVNVSGITLTSNETSATYQWVDCNNSFLPVLGEIASVFVPGVNGDYAVVVTQNGCTDTSACYLINSVGIENIPPHSQIYPNPFHEYFTIDISTIEKDVRIFVTDISGKQVEVTSSIQGNTYIFYPQTSAGVYFVHIQGPSNYAVVKIVKQ